MPTYRAYTARRIFTGTEWLTDHAIVADDEMISDVIPLAKVPEGIHLHDYAGSQLVPAFIDLQIYGAYGKLFAVYPEPDALDKLYRYCKAGGAPYCMPTVATNEYEVFFRAIDAIREYWTAGGKGILGLHVEGPWINPKRRGAHIESLIHSPTMEQATKLLEYGKGVIRIITLAPECCDPAILDLIRSYGVIISAGHSDATYQEARNAFVSGIPAVTHLYNAMSPLQHRAPGLAGAAMDDPNVMASIIPDGFHVDFAAIRIAKAVMKERLFVITDAVTDTTIGPYPHQRDGEKYVSNGILSGSALTMAQAVRNLIKEVQLSPEEAIRMCSLYPASLLKQPGLTGRIEKGSKAKWVVMDGEWGVVNSE